MKFVDLLDDAFGGYLGHTDEKLARLLKPHWWFPTFQLETES
jgi:hypothetical protein